MDESDVEYAGFWVRVGATIAVVAAAVAGLGACGGGGSSDAPAPTASWAPWTKNTSPVFSGPYHLVGDPSVIRDGSIYRMFYNCYDTKRKRGAICQVTSPDGITWTDVPVQDTIGGRMIQTRGEDKWDTAHETPAVIKYKGEYLLYFTGYVHRGDFGTSFPYHIGLATSPDGVTFTRYTDGPVLSPTPGGYDSLAVFSPTVIEYEGKLLMVYTGMCSTACTHADDTGIQLMAATSEDGRVWTKRDMPVIPRSMLSFLAKDGAAESNLVKGPDDFYYLFMSLLYGDTGHEIGVARASSPYGPWDIDPAPIIKKSPGAFDSVGPIAPSVLFENGKARMWYHGFGSKSIDIGYAEAELPLKLK